jgi:hypothetical protein
VSRFGKLFFNGRSWVEPLRPPLETTSLPLRFDSTAPCTVGGMVEVEIWQFDISARWFPKMRTWFPTNPRAREYFSKTLQVLINNKNLWCMVESLSPTCPNEYKILSVRSVPRTLMVLGSPHWVLFPVKNSTHILNYSSSDWSGAASESELNPSRLRRRWLQQFPHWCVFRKVSMPVFPWSPTPLEL